MGEQLFSNIKKMISKYKKNMIKKFILFLTLCFLISSCGKKGDPVYEDQQKKSSIQNIQITKV